MGRTFRCRAPCRRLASRLGTANPHRLVRHSNAPQELVATVTSAADLAPQPAHATATVTAGPPVTLGATPTAISARIGDTIAKPIVVAARDQYGNSSGATRPAVNVRLVETDRAIAAGAISVQADSAGIATFSGLAITGHAGAATLLFESAGLASARVALDLVPGPPASVTLETSTVVATARAAGPPLNAQVLDGWKNAVVGATVTIAVDGVGEIGRAVTDSAGVATLPTWTVPGIGNYRLVATVSGSGISAQAALVSRAGAPVGVVVSPTSPTSAVVGSELTLSAWVVDAGGNVLPNQAIDWSIANGGNGHVVSEVDGVALVIIRLPQKAGQNQVTLKSGSATTTIVITGRAGLPARVQPVTDTALTAPAGSTMSVGFRVQDQYDNPVPGVVVPVYSPFGLTVNSSSAVTNSNGIATFTVVLNPLAMANYMRVNLGFVGGFAATTIYGTASRGTIEVMDMVPVCPVRSGTTGVLVVVAVYSANGHPAVNVPVTFSVSAGNGVIHLNSGADVSSIVVSTTGADAGFASANWVIPKTAGTYALTAQASAGSYAQSPLSIGCSVIP